MSVKEFLIFLIFLRVGTICGENYLTNIRDDYCVLYCGNECKDDNSSKSDKTCTQTDNTIITNNYKLELVDEILSLVWFTSNPDLQSLIKLSSGNVTLRELDVTLDHDDKGFHIVQSALYLQELGINSLRHFELKVLKLIFMENPNSITLGAKNLHIYVNNNSTVNYPLIFNYLRQNSNNYCTIVIACEEPYKIPDFVLDELRNQKNLTELEIRECKLEKINASTFEYLKNLKTLVVTDPLLEDFEFLSSKTLQNNLEEIFHGDYRKMDLKYFKNYSKLKWIHLKVQNSTAAVTSYNKLKPFVCEHTPGYKGYKPLLCNFTLGINERRCPQRCNCSLDYDTNTFFIDCIDQGLREVPELPVPITGRPTLLFQGNKLITLPNISDPGFANLAELHLSHNNLTYLTADQLPPGLTLLDIQNNSIQTVDEKVASFLLNRINKTKLLQAGILWISECGNTNLTTYLKELGKTKEEPVLHHHLSGPCPNHCTCCFNGTSKQFVIDCRNRGLINFPILPPGIKGNSTLRMDDNQLEVLPRHSLLNSTLKELHMKNNFLTSLTINQLPPNITYLDIRNNSLSELDDKVTQFLLVRSHYFKIELTGNPWECSCKLTKFLTFLKIENSKEYEAALRRCTGQEYCPSSCLCCLDYDTGKFIINCSNQGLSEIPAIPITNYSVLLFEYNLLTNLSNNLPQGFDQLKELHLAHNHIWDIERVPSNLTLLDLGRNKLQRLSRQMVDLLTNQSQLTLSISGNPWICSCEEIHFLRFTKQFAGNIINLCRVKCPDSTLLIKKEEKDLCPLEIPGYVFFLVAIIGFTIALNCLQYFRESIKMWFYNMNLCLGLTDRREIDKEKIFDAFLTYTHKDAELVDEYIEVLEKGVHKFRLCYYERDWLPGLSIPACICQSVEDSKRIIILMTKNFLKSPWGRLEFRVALQATSEDKCKRLIIVVYPDVENFDELDSELKLYMTFNKYLNRNDPDFWNKLIYAMPHRKNDSKVMFI